MLQDLVWLDTYPFIAVLYYYTWALALLNPRLKLLFGRTHDNYLEWAEANPELNGKLRIAIEIAPGWLSFRNLHTVFSSPWLFARSGDPRRSDADRSVVCDRLCAFSLELFDEWFGEKGVDL